MQEQVCDMEQQNARVESVPGPNGQPLTVNDLPPRHISRWVTRRKAEVVAAVDGGLISQQEALERYGLSAEEFEGWQRLYRQHGPRGLRATRLQNYR